MSYYFVSDDEFCKFILFYQNSIILFYGKNEIRIYIITFGPKNYKIDNIKNNILKKNIYNKERYLYTVVGKGNLLNIDYKSTIIKSKLFLKEIQFYEINKFLNNFKKSTDFYKYINKMFSKGFLLHGPPGTGKTTFVKFIAYKYKYNIVIVNLGNKNINDSNINNIFDLNNTIYLFEDIDSYFKDGEINNNNNSIKINVLNENKNENGNSDDGILTLSGLLNVLDGLS